MAESGKGIETQGKAKEMHGGDEQRKGTAESRRANELKRGANLWAAMDRNCADEIGKAKAWQGYDAIRSAKKLQGPEMQRKCMAGLRDAMEWQRWE